MPPEWLHQGVPPLCSFERTLQTTAAAGKEQADNAYIVPCSPILRPRDGRFQRDCLSPVIKLVSTVLNVATQRRQTYNGSRSAEQADGTAWGNRKTALHACIIGCVAIAIFHYEPKRKEIFIDKKDASKICTLSLIKENLKPLQFR